MSTMSSSVILINMIAMILNAVSIEGSGSLEICEGSTETIGCHQGSAISITEAWYGNKFGGSSCGSYFYPNCYSSSVSSKVRNACDGEPQCTLTASDRIYGDPCSVDWGIFEFDTDEFLKVSFICVAVPEMTTTGKTTTLFTATSNSQNLTENSRPQVRETTLVQLSASPSAETTFVVNAKSVYDSSLYETSFSDRSTASTAALPTSQVRQATSAASDITSIPTSVVPTLLSTNAISSSFKSATSQNAAISSAASLNPIVVQSTLEKTAAASYEQTSISLTRAKIATNFNVNFGTEQNGFRRSIASDFLQKSNEDRIQNIIYIAIGTALGVVVLLLIAITVMRIWHSKKTLKKSNLEKDQEKAKHGSNTKNYSKYPKATNDAVSNDMSFVSAVKTSSTELEANQEFIFKKTAEKFRPVDIVCD